MSFYCRCEYYFLKHIGKCWEAPFTPKSISLLFKIYSVFVIHFPKYISLKNKIFRYFVFLIVAFLVVISFLFTVLSHSSFISVQWKVYANLPNLKQLLAGIFFPAICCFFQPIDRIYFYHHIHIFFLHTFLSTGIIR